MYETLSQWHNVLTDPTRSAHCCTLRPVGKLRGPAYPRVSDDNVLSLFWLLCLGYHQPEEHQWRTLSVRALRLYNEWYVHNGHESLWHPLRVWEEGDYLLRVTKWHNPWTRCHHVHCQSQESFHGFWFCTQPNAATNWVYTRSIRELEVLQIDADTSECDHHNGQVIFVYSIKSVKLFICNGIKKDEDQRETVSR